MGSDNWWRNWIDHCGHCMVLVGRQNAKVAWMSTKEKIVLWIVGTAAVLTYIGGSMLIAAVDLGLTL